MIKLEWTSKRKIAVKEETGIKEIVTKTFSALTGTWEAFAVAISGKHTQTPFVAKRIYLDDARKRLTIDALARPFGRRSCWRIMVIPPENYTEDDIRACLGEKTDEPEEKEEEATPLRDTRLVVGKIFQAEVRSRLDYGLVVTLPKFDVEGIVPLEELSEEYSTDEVYNWEEGDKFYVMMTSNAKKAYKFSKIRADLANETTSDTYTGVVDADGTLSLVDYTKSLDRCLKLVDWVVDIQEKYYPEPIPKDELYTFIYVKFTDDTGAKHVGTGAVYNVLDALASTSRGYLAKTWDKDGKLEGWLVTDFGWGEVGRIVGGGQTKPVPTLAPTSNPEPKQKPTPKPTPKPVPEVVQADPASEDADVTIVTVIGKLAEYVRVLDSMKSLQHERDELEFWMLSHRNDIEDMNRHAKEATT